MISPVRFSSALFLVIAAVACLMIVPGCADAHPPAKPAVSHVTLPLLSRDDVLFFHDQAKRIAAAARVAPGEKAGDTVNTTPYVMITPDSQLAYPAFWLRDSDMALGADLVSARDTSDWIRLTASVLRTEDWHLRPGVDVPAYSVPDHINLNGKATFFPGNYDTDEQQGGSSFGNLPPLDDPFYFLFSVYDNWKLTHSLGLFRSNVALYSGKMKLSDLCLRVFDAVPVDKPTGLVVAGDVDTQNAKDFGFCDGVFKSGKLLFTSVLRYDAALRMAEMFQAAGDNSAAGRLRREAALIRGSIGPTFYQEGPKSGEGWLYSATGVGHQADVWGSAYAIAIGAVSKETAAKVAHSLVRGYRDHSLVQNGCVTEVLPLDPANPHGWQKTGEGFGTYQNGGYWGTGTGWYIAGMYTADPAAARDMAREYVTFLRQNIRPDGMTSAWEWFNPNTKAYVHPLYVATVAHAYTCLKRAKLID